MKYLYMVVCAVVGGLLGWGLGLYVLGPGQLILVTSIWDTTLAFILGMLAYLVCIWGGMLIGAILFGRLGYRVGKHLHEPSNEDVHL